MSKFIGMLLLCVSCISFSTTPLHKTSAQEIELSLQTSTGELKGSLIMSPAKNKIIALIIAGSGPTDRNGNNPMMINNSLKMLAEGLAEFDISSVRYDKRGVAQSASAGVSEQDLRFEHYINDAKQWVDYIKNTLKAEQIIVIGHSEGALIGAVAAQQANVDKFISLAGAGKPIDEVLREQLKGQPPIVLETALPILDSLMAGETVADVPAYLNALFRPSVQPYLVSWFAYNPAKEIANLSKPVLIIQGTNDIQVSLEDARLLSQAKPDAKLLIIEKMNHIFKDAEADRQANMLTYSQADLPLSEALVPAISEFIHSR